MISSEPYNIEVKHSDDAQRLPQVTVGGAGTYNMDEGVLTIPPHIAIGQLSHDGSKILSYGNQVEEYDVWLEDQIKSQNVAVMEALDDIYNRAIGSGIVLTTRCIPSPYMTHAHVVKKVILNLMGV